MQRPRRITWTGVRVGRGAMGGINESRGLWTGCWRAFVVWAGVPRVSDGEGGIPGRVKARRNAGRDGALPRSVDLSREREV